MSLQKVPEYLPSSVPMIGSVADNHNSFTGNEDKYVKLKQKQYVVGTSSEINGYYMSMACKRDQYKLA